MTPTEGPAGEVDSTEDDGPGSAAQRRRRDLRERHAELRTSAPDEVDDQTLTALFALTDEVLMLEDHVVEHREQEHHRHGSRRIYAASAALVLGATAMLVVGLSLGWIAGWGLAAVILTGVVGLLMAATHAIAEPTGHRTRSLTATLSLVPGLALVALAPGWLPWWAGVIALVLLLGPVVRFLSTVRIIDHPVAEHER